MRATCWDQSVLLNNQPWLQCKKINILAIDTSTSLCSVALVSGDDLWERQSLSPKQHTALVLPFVEALLKEAKLDLSQLDAIAFGAGPGSFTGVRIAASVTQGIALAHNLPVVPISTLAALAYQAVRRFGARNIVPILDARMGQVYWGDYQWDEQLGLRCQPSDQLTAPDVLRAYFSERSRSGPEGSRYVAIGEGLKAYPDFLSDQAEPGCFFENRYPDCYPLAIDVAALAIHEFRAGNFISADQVTPVYFA